ncbi:MAG: L-serine ammonia-lyase, iron-sulfur-dependent subunit beta [Candidatus Pelethousia sp.]|nr:L-serine ammonia-lyase, iron-sulfur-dependent subunit beta [Candidatus Pelethousia sp.]
MQTFKTFDIVGPRMIGPSSSHTAGAARLAHIAWHIAGEDVVRAELTLYGSFAETGRGHGTDKALLAGVLGLEPDDERLRYSMLLAKEAGVEYEIHYCAEPPADYDYANMARIRIEGHDGKVTDVLGASIGGGNILITEINGMEVSFTGEYPTLIVRHIDVRGTISKVTAVLAKAGINVAGMRVFRHSKGQHAYMVIETDTPVPPQVQADVLACGENIQAVRAIENH